MNFIHEWIIKQNTKLAKPAIKFDTLIERSPIRGFVSYFADRWQIESLRFSRDNSRKIMTKIHWLCRKRKRYSPSWHRSPLLPRGHWHLCSKNSAAFCSPASSSLTSLKFSSRLLSMKQLPPGPQSSEHAGSVLVMLAVVDVCFCSRFGSCTTQSYLFSAANPVSVYLHFNFSRLTVYRRCFISRCIKWHYCIPLEIATWFFGTSE